jgi:hypothetical protein
LRSSLPSIRAAGASVSGGHGMIKLPVVLTILIFNLLASYYQPPTAGGVVDPLLKGHQ